MNVLYVCADQGIPLLGGKGAAVHVRAVTSAMQALGHQVTVAVRRLDAGSAGQGRGRAENDPPKVHRLEPLAEDTERAAGQLSTLITDTRADVVIERYSLQSGAARIAARRHGLPLTLEVNAPLAREATRYRGLDDPGAQDWEQETFQAADRIQVVSSALLHYVRSVAPEVPTAWIPNGTDVAAFRDARAMPASATNGRLPSRLDKRLGGRLVVGFAGSMKPWHGVADLLDAFAIMPTPPGEPGPPVLLLVGDGPEAGALRRRAAAPDLAGRVVFTGPRPHDAIPDLVRRFAVAVAPYRPMPDFYFLPLKVAEYLAAGVPVIYPEQGDLCALVGDAGLGYPPGDQEQLGARLSRLTGDEALRRDMASAADRRADALDWQHVARRVLAFATARSLQAPCAVRGGLPKSSRRPSSRAPGRVCSAASGSPRPAARRACPGECRGRSSPMPSALPGCRRGGR